MNKSKQVMDICKFMSLKQQPVDCLEATTGFLHLQQETTAAFGLTVTNKNQLEQTQLLTNRSMTNTGTMTENIHQTKTFFSG
jgi:hypothetical protein